ncbi:predicted protein [Botrytis cinerea T4]|uniref:Uncharacterized protein n=1 Tax=Botryotinia fuckeliana (strain T4) TaxID=999810 RepID=G2YMM7_BOTF4|nr:predicted protein [Botrytis cinerea T4]
MLLESSLDIVPPGGRAHAGTIEKRKVLETHSPAYKYKGDGYPISRCV